MTLIDLRSPTSGETEIYGHPAKYINTGTYMASAKQESK